ncbi:MAG: DUF2339 domain-containing protein [Actinophytocola sp.]|uniref:DUF2339 domain-containing protein n=1 Tax=Actinophytocola sp. TaxID=1872138 RepID=UPI00132BBECC|nr:DUF2339 domain-containing protein [Actinophytocola sp.]MPZ84641.1 DUF2339 domain-containing protein [Actinophytocola sp.]
MATESSDPLPRLAAALLEVSARIHDISTELRDLHLATVAADPVANPVAAPQPPAPPANWQPAPPAPQTRAWPEPAPIPTWPQLPPYQPPAPPKPSFWEREGAGSRVLAWAGGVVTLAGVVLLLILAIQRGYLGPLPRVLCGAVLGLGLVGIGMRLHRNPASRTGAFALAATGIAVLYLDVIAATVLFGFLPPLAGLVAGLAVAGLGLLLAARWDAQPLAVFVVVCCACCAPFLTDGFVPLLLGFLLVLEIGATPVQLAKRWGWLCLAAGIPPVLATLVTIALSTGGQDDAATVAYLALVTSAAQVLVATVSRPDDDWSVGLLLLAPAPAMLGAVLLPKAGAIVLPAAIGVLLVAAWALRRTPRFGLAAGAGASVALLQATATALDGSALAIVLLAEALLVALVAQGMRYPAALAAAALFGFAGLSVTLSTALPGDLVGTPPDGQVPLGTVATAGLTGLLLTVSMLATCRVAGRLGVLTGDTARPAWILGGLVALYGATGTVLSIGLLVSPDRTGFLLGHVLVTVSWTVGALVLLLRGIDSMPLRVAGLSLVGAALVKLVLFDLSSLDGMARVAAFLVAGLVLLAAGTRYARLVASRATEPHTSGT